MSIYKKFISSLTFVLLSSLSQQTHSSQDEENGLQHQNAGLQHNEPKSCIFLDREDVIRNAGYYFLNYSDIVKLSMGSRISYNGVRNDFTKHNCNNAILSPNHNDDAAFKSIKQIFPSVSNLFLNNCYYISDENLNELSNSIMHLDISGCNITDNGANIIAERCRDLHTLSVARCTKLTDASLLQFAGTYKYLVKLNISGCREFAEDSIVTIINNNKNLEYINISKCTNVRDKTILAIANTCHDLTGLETGYCFRIKTKLPYLLEKCVKIILFNISNCYNISKINNVVSVLAHNAPNLQTLSLANCDDITDAYAVLIIKNCPTLAFLDLTACDMLTDESAFEIGMNAKELQSLNMSGCKKITDVILKLLCVKGRQLSKMRYVNLNGCTKITNDIITHFTKVFHMKTLEDKVFSRKLFGE